MSAPRVMFARNGGIGNALASVPALRALRHAWPESHITVVVDPASASALAGCPYVNELLMYEKRGADAGLRGWLRILGELRKRRFTHAILSKRFLRMSLLARLSGARVRVGFEGYGHAITHPVKWNPHRSVVKTNLDLLAALGVPPQGYELEIWPSEEDKKIAETFLENNALKNHQFIVTIHPGGISQRDYLWPVENYVELASSLEEVYGAGPVFVGGPPDAEVLAAVRSFAGHRFPICNELSIPGLAHLISRSRFFIGSDSAPSHLATATGAPAVIYYGSKPDREENLARWMPLTGIVVPALPLSDAEHLSVGQVMECVAELMEKMSEAESGVK